MMFSKAKTNRSKQAPQAEGASETLIEYRIEDEW